MDWYRAKVARKTWLGIVAGVAGIALVGCQPSGAPEESAAAPAAPVAPQKLRLVAVDDTPALAPQLARLWTAETGGELEVVACSSADLASGTNVPSNADLWLYPNVQLGDMLGQQRIQMLDPHWGTGTDSDRGSLLPLERGVVVHAGTRTAAVSLGAPLFVVFYRQDVWDALSLSAPETWEDYLAAAQKIHAARETLAQHDPPLPAAICEPWEGIWQAELFLARAATRFGKQGRLSTFFDIATLEPLVGTPPFVAAAADMRALQPLLSPPHGTPYDCYRKIAAGEAALAIGFAAGQLQIDAAAAEFPVSIRPLPAANQIYDFRSQSWETPPAEQPRIVFVPTAGRLVSLGADCRRIRTAMRLLSWLGRPETNRQIGRFIPDAGPLTEAALDPPYEWLASQLPRAVAENWAQLIRDANFRSLPIGSLRIAHRQEFMTGLNRELTAILAGAGTPESGLAAVVAEWQKLIERSGRAALTAEYRATLGVD